MNGATGEARLLKWATYCHVAFGMVLLVMIEGCKPSSAENEFNQRVAQSKVQHTAVEIRGATIPLFNKFVYGDNQPILNNELPKEITTLPLFPEGPESVSAYWLVSDSNALMFVAGGGFGHWGIVVSRVDGDRQVVKLLGYRVTPWTNGVFFYSE